MVEVNEQNKQKNQLYCLSICKSSKSVYGSHISKMQYAKYWLYLVTREECNNMERPI